MRGCGPTLIATAVLLAGCGGGGGGESVAKTAGRMLSDTAHQTPAFVKARTVKALDELLSAESVDEALAGALCQGVTSLANQGSLPDGSDWRDFLISFVEGRLVGVSHTIVADKVDELNATANLAQINAASARYYLQGCVARL